MKGTVMKTIETSVAISLKPPSQKTADMWTDYRITWIFVTKLCASIPADPEIVKGSLNIFILIN